MPINPPTVTQKERLGAGDFAARAKDPRKLRLHRRFSVFRRRLRKAGWLREYILFLSRFAGYPGKIGAIAPSSRGLGRAMAAGISGSRGVCVELGGGTGSLTRAILSAGVPRSSLIVVEQDPRLVGYLRRRFHDTLIVEGDAQNLGKILREIGVERVGAVVSGLPFRSLPIAVRRNIAAATFATLEPGGVFVQFTYWGEPPIPDEVKRQYEITGAMTNRVWWNIPPANVWCYTRPAELD